MTSLNSLSIPLMSMPVERSLQDERRSRVHRFRDLTFEISERMHLGLSIDTFKIAIVADPSTPVSNMETMFNRVKLTAHPFFLLEYEDIPEDLSRAFSHINAIEDLDIRKREAARVATEFCNWFNSTH